jgi:hypothetical protein
MPDKIYRPGPLAPVQRIETADGWCLVLTRDLAHRKSEL